MLSIYPKRPDWLPEKVALIYATAKKETACYQCINFKAGADCRACPWHEYLVPFLEAHAELREMRKIWPRVPQGRETVEQIVSDYPLVAVGVDELPIGYDSRSLASASVAAP